MKRLEKNIFPLLVLMLLAASCQKDDDPGFATRDDYLGIWQCDEFDVSQSLIATFQIEILAHPTESNKVYIDNFNLQGQGFQAEAEVDNTTITIPQQMVAASVVTGTGFISNGLTGLELQYTLDDGSGQPENLTATCTKL